MLVNVIDFTISSSKMIKSALQKMNEVQSVIEFRYAGISKDNRKNLSEELNPEETYNLLDKLKKERNYQDHLVAVFDIPFDNNWFSVTDSSRSLSIITIADWDMLSHLRIESYLVMEITENLLEQLLQMEDYNYTHEPPIGCISDMCVYKIDLNLKLLTAYICPKCTELIEQRVSTNLIEPFNELFNLSREYAFNRVSDKQEIVEDNLMFPISVYLRKLKSEPGVRDRFSVLLDLFDVIIRTTVIVLNARVKELSNNHTLPFEHPNPSLGDWVTSLDEAIKFLEAKKDDFFKKHFMSLKDCSKLISQKKLVNLRNDTKGHAYTLPLDEVNNLFQSNTGHIQSILDKLKKFLSLNMYRVINLSFERNRGNKLLAYKLNGSNPIFQKEELSIIPIENKRDILNSEDEILVFKEDFRDYLTLFPNLLYNTCPTCNQPRTLIIDSEKLYLDLQMGHRVRIENGELTNC